MVTNANNQSNDDKCLEMEAKKRKISEDKLKKIIKEQFRIKSWIIKNELKK